MADGWGCDGGGDLVSKRKAGKHKRSSYHIRDLCGKQKDRKRRIVQRGVERMGRESVAYSMVGTGKTNAFPSPQGEGSAGTGQGSV